MREVEHRLLRRTARLPLAVIVAAGAGSTCLLVAQAWLLAHVVTAGFLGRSGVAPLAPQLVALAGAFAGRGALGWASEVAGVRAAASVKSRLRVEVAARLPSLRLTDVRTGELAQALAAGLDAIDGYCGRYLPQLVVAVVAPALIVAWALPRDPLSALILCVTAPLVPLFMALIGLAARDRTERRWRAMGILSAHFLDVVQGLATLRIFGRATAQEGAIRRVTDQHRAAAMATLRAAFLSTLALELAATLGTALVAVAIGLRLDAGRLRLEDGLAILVLAPEVYLPLRRLGAQFHASMEAFGPAERALGLLDQALPAGGTRTPDLRREEIAFEDVCFSYPGRGAVLEGVTFSLRPGEKVALTGSSGAGKTTLLSLLLGFDLPGRGQVTVGGVPLAQLSLAALRRQIGWMPQAPRLVPATLSTGERQRVALRRALDRRAPLLLLDEPTAGLDAAARRQLASELRGLRATALVATHDPELAASCDRQVMLR